MANNKNKNAGDTYRQTDVMHLAKNRGISMDDAKDLIERSGVDRRDHGAKETKMSEVREQIAGSNVS